jgi:hypothetical protein
MTLGETFFLAEVIWRGILLWHVTFSRLGRCSNLQTNYDDDRRMCLYYVRRQALPYMKSQVINVSRKYPCKDMSVALRIVVSVYRPFIHGFSTTPLTAQFMWLRIIRWLMNNKQWVVNWSVGAVNGCACGMSLRWCPGSSPDLDD